jgi:hypothetical protein
MLSSVSGVQQVCKLGEAQWDGWWAVYGGCAGTPDQTMSVPCECFRMWMVWVNVYELF